MAYLESRYDYDGLDTRRSKKIESGKEVERKRFETSLLPAIPERDGDLWVMTRAGDRLDLLSKEYYGTPNLWWYIAQANGLGKGTWYVEPALTIRIPAYFQYQDQIEEVSNYNNRR